MKSFTCIVFFIIIFVLSSPWFGLVSGNRHAPTKEKIEKGCREVVGTIMRSSEFRNAVMDVNRAQANTKSKCSISSYTTYFEPETQTCVDCKEKIDCDKDPICTSNCQEKLLLNNLVDRVARLEWENKTSWTIAVISVITSMALFIMLIAHLVYTCMGQKRKLVETTTPYGDQREMEDGAGQDGRTF